MVLESFHANGKDYEIRIVQLEEGIVIRAFQSGRAANGYSYHVTLPDNIALKNVLGLHGIRYLAEKAKEDVVERRFERLMEMLGSQS